MIDVNLYCANASGRSQNKYVAAIWASVKLFYVDLQVICRAFISSLFLCQWPGGLSLLSCFPPSYPTLLQSGQSN